MMKEGWIPIKGFENSYEVSNFGRVRSLDKFVGHRWGGLAKKTGRVLKLQSDKDGYAIVGLSQDGIQKTHKVHRLVAIHFLQESDLGEINHIDLDKKNNSASNLAWVTRKENQTHAADSGKFTARHNPKRAKKLNVDVVDQIRNARAEGMTFNAIGAKFGISAPVALKVVRGDVWKA